MSNSNEIFFSYAWADSNETNESREKIVDELYQSLKNDGYNVIRDKNDLKYKGFISDFMTRIGEGKNVVIVISSKYVRSPYCMFELYEIARNSNFDKQKFANKVFPIKIESIDFNKPEVLDEYLSYWKNEFEKWDELIKNRSGELSGEQFQRYDKIKMVYQNFGKLVDWLIDMNTLNPPLLSRENFKEIKNSILENISSLRNRTDNRTKTRLVLAILVIASIAIISIFLKYRGESKMPMQVTVFVHGKKGPQDMILRKQGYVIMDVNGGERKKEDINEKGMAFFQNLRVGDGVRINVDFSEPYKSLYPDSVFTIKSSGEIYLPVALQGIDKVKGRVIFDEAPLKGVIVSIDNLSTQTDSNGRYELQIPEKQQKQHYEVWFNKDGWKIKSAMAYPQTDEPLNIVMEK